VNKKVLITGVFGQDGSYLAELLQAQGYDIHGVARLPLSPHATRIAKHLQRKNIKLTAHECNLYEYDQVKNLIESVQPDECYHLAATHFSAHRRALLGIAEERNVYQHNVLSAFNILSAVTELSYRTRIVLAGSCMMYDAAIESPQNEQTPYSSKSLYGLSKIATTQLTQYFRQTHGLQVSVAILYNHESPRRSDDFVTQRIVKNVVRIVRNEIEYFELGNLWSVRDWGYARDYAEAMWHMCLQDDARDYVLATGIGRTVEQFVSTAADIAGLRDWRMHIHTLESGTPGKDQMPLVGDASQAYKQLKWRHSLTFQELVQLMVERELEGTFD